MNVRGKDYCRGCGSNTLSELMNLNSLPIANELHNMRGVFPERYPLVLSLCRSCLLGQVADVVPPDRLFEDYRYLSSISKSFLVHASVYVNQIIERLEIDRDDWILEIASNDGYLLRNFVEKGFACLGIEPSKNVAKIAEDKGIPTINEFFGSELARQLLEERGHPRLIVANNVLAHVPDLSDFIQGLEILCGENTVITIENPTLLNIKKNSQFDSIYHEHYSYLTLTALTRLLLNRSIEIFDIDYLETHGGSLRYFIAKRGKSRLNKTKLSTQLSLESTSKMFELAEWIDVRSKAEEIATTFKAFLQYEVSLGKVIWGYGAAAKASTIINYSEIEANWISGIADQSPEKQGRYLPGVDIPIMPPEIMYESNPDHIVIFPWNITSEIAREIRQNCSSKVRVWRLIPGLTEII